MQTQSSVPPGGGTTPRARRKGHLVSFRKGQGPTASIDFDAVAALALANARHLLPRWFPLMIAPRRSTSEADAPRSAA